MMDDRTLVNSGKISGEYNGVDFADSKSSAISVTMPEIPFIKEADQEIWFSGDLTITLTVDNSVGNSPLENVVIKDDLDIAKIQYVADSVTMTVDDEPSTDFSASYTEPTLTVTLTEDIAVGKVVKISFRGKKVPV